MNNNIFNIPFLYVFQFIRGIYQRILIEQNILNDKYSLQIDVYFSLFLFLYYLSIDRPSVVIIAAVINMFGVLYHFDFALIYLYYFVAVINVFGHEIFQNNLSGTWLRVKLLLLYIAFPNNVTIQYNIFVIRLFKSFKLITNYYFYVIENN